MSTTEDVVIDEETGDEIKVARRMKVNFTMAYYHNEAGLHRPGVQMIPAGWQMPLNGCIPLDATAKAAWAAQHGDKKPSRRLPRATSAPEELRNVRKENEALQDRIAAISAEAAASEARRSAEMQELRDAIAAAQTPAPAAPAAVKDPTSPTAAKKTSTKG